MTVAKWEEPLARSNSLGAEPQGWEDLRSTRPPPPRGVSGPRSAWTLERESAEVQRRTSGPRTLTLPSGLQVIAEQTSQLHVLVSIVCAAGSQILESTGPYLASYATAQFTPRKGRRLGLAAHELLSNAVSYAAPGDVTIQLFQETNAVGIRVVNDALEARLRQLDEHLQRLGDSPRGQQLDAMRHLAIHGRRPKLGLARVIQEARCELDFEVGGRRVTATARCRD